MLAVANGQGLLTLWVVTDVSAESTPRREKNFAERSGVY